MVFITAEIGINHNGDVNIAKKLINIAKKSGCDAVKFQKRTIEKVYSEEILNSPRESPWGTTMREQKLGLEFNKKEYDIIDNYCKEKNIEWYASSWDIDSQLFLQNYNFKHNKIASAMLTNHKLLKVIAEEKKIYLDHQRIDPKAIVIIDSALLIESQNYKNVDRVIIVQSSDKLQIQRVVNRNLESSASVKKRLKAQMPLEEKLNYADYILYNSRDRKQLKSQVHSLYFKLKDLS